MANIDVAINNRHLLLVGLGCCCFGRMCLRSGCRNPGQARRGRLCNFYDALNGLPATIVYRINSAALKLIDGDYHPGNAHPFYWVVDVEPYILA